MSRFVFSCLLSLAILWPGSISAQLSAVEILDRAAETYNELEWYQDVGEIEVITSVDEIEEVSVHFFETRLSPNHFSWRLRSPAQFDFVERIFWLEKGNIRAYDGSLQQTRSLPSLSSELVERFGELAFDSFDVIRALSVQPHVLSFPTLPVLEGTESCGEGTSCFVVSWKSTLPDGSLRIRIDSKRFLIRQIESSETRQIPASNTSAANRRRAKRGGRENRAATYSATLRVRHRPRTPSTTGDDELTFVPPSFAEEVAEWRLPLIDVDKTALPPSRITRNDPKHGVFFDEVTVRLLTVHARILERSGKIMRDLEPEDVVVRIGGTIAPVSAVDWHGPETHRGGPSTGSASPPLIVIFLQNDFQPGRIRGQLGLLPRLQRMIRGLEGDARVAVLSFFRHLTLWHDFSQDREAIAQVLERAVFPGAKPRELQAAGDQFSLIPHFNTRHAAKAAHASTGLILTANALANLPGEKSLVYAGFGIGGGRSVAKAMLDARTTPFILDVTQADFHSLEGSLESLAASTGGTYSSTFASRAGAVRRVERMISGYYAIVIDGSSLPEEGGRLKMKLSNRRGSIIFPSMDVSWR